MTSLIFLYSLHLSLTIHFSCTITSLNCKTVFLKIIHPLKSLPHCIYPLPRFPVIISIFPAKPKCLSDEGKDVCVLQDGLGGGFPCTVPTAGVYPNHQRLMLHRAAAHSVLQGSTVLQSVERHHTIIVICCQKQDGRVGRARVR